MEIYGILLLHTILQSTVAYRLIDLSHKHGPTTFMVPGQTHYNRSIVSRVNLSADVWAETGFYSSAEHGGTHIDAPSHFSKGNLTIALDDVPLENTIAEGVMIDVSKEAKENILYQVPLSKILEWEKIHGDIPNEAAVIFNFGWHKRFHNKTLYINTETDDWSLIKIPTVSMEVADYLYDKRNIRILGVDNISPDAFDSGFPIHVKYLPNNILIVENLNATDLLPPQGFRFHASPVKYVGASGAQVRAFAVVHENADSAAMKFSWAWLLMISLLLISMLS